MNKEWEQILWLFRLSEANDSRLSSLALWDAVLRCSVTDLTKLSWQQLWTHLSPQWLFPLNCLELKLIYDSVFFSAWYLAAALFWKQSLERVNGWYLSSLIPDQGGPRVVDGGQLRLRVLGEEERLLYSPQRGRRLAAQGSCRRPA